MIEEVVTEGYWADGAPGSGVAEVGNVSELVYEGLGLNLRWRGLQGNRLWIGDWLVLGWLWWWLDQGTLGLRLGWWRLLLLLLLLREQTSLLIFV